MTRSLPHINIVNMKAVPTYLSLLGSLVAAREFSVNVSNFTLEKDRFGEFPQTRYISFDIDGFEASDLGCTLDPPPGFPTTVFYCNRTISRYRFNVYWDRPQLEAEYAVKLYYYDDSLGYDFLHPNLVTIA